MVRFSQPPRPTTILLALGAWAIAAQLRGGGFEQDVLPVLKDSCFECHSGAEPEGGLDLAKFHTEEEALAAPEVWDKVWKRVNKFEMPPEGSPRIGDRQAALMGWIDANRRPSGDCNQLASDETMQWYGGIVMSRRLTRAEYNHSIRDLVGVDLRPADAFPADGSGGEGFDNVGSTLFLSPVQLEKYLAAAEAVLDAALPTDAAQQKIMIATPDGGRSPREAARVIVADFARRAYRRPVENDDVERLLSMFDRAQRRGDDFQSSVKLALEAVLISPHFLFLSEPEPDAGGVYQLGQYQIAERLAYFLWASMPDDELLRLADDGILTNEAVLRGQVRRMLADPKAHGFAESFATQWLGIGALGQSVRPDSVRFPDFDDQLAADMRAEAVALVETVFREDRSLLELLDCDYALVNSRLAEHYGLPPIVGDELRRVPLEDGRRGGVLGLGAVLTATSYPLRTSPVIRGKWVLETLLGSVVPPPPPNAGKLPDDDHDLTRDQTFRQQLEAHRTKPECAACHARMDPLGFGLENFDAIGRWRHHQNGQPVDSSGQLPSGEAFSGPDQLKHVLLAHKDEFIQNLCRKMLGYALGRGLNKFDDCVVRDGVEALAANDYRSSALIETIVTSYPFQHRYARK